MARESGMTEGLNDAMLRRLKDLERRVSELEGKRRPRGLAGHFGRYHQNTGGPLSQELVDSWLGPFREPKEPKG